MMSDQSNFNEDDEILSKLDHEEDIEAFSNLMEHAHGLGMSAADFVREEPKRTSRKYIRKLCLSNQKRTIKMMVASILKGLWDRPVQDPAESFAQTLYKPPTPAKPHVNGQARKASCE
jgi:hypothetical protein